MSTYHTMTNKDILKSALALVASLFALSVAHSVAADAPLDIGSRRELFVDGFLVDRLAGKASLRLHHPVPQKIAIVHDAPWEGSGCVYHSIFKDGGLYRMYYAAGQLTVTPNGVAASTHGLFCCYAESDDGLHWRKPELGLHEFKGSKANNIVMVKQKIGTTISEPGEPAVFKDENPAAPLDARYKALLPASRLRPDQRRGLLAFKSPDGLHWSPMSGSVFIERGRNTPTRFTDRNLLSGRSAVQFVCRSNLLKWSYPSRSEL